VVHLSVPPFLIGAAKLNPVVDAATFDVSYFYFLRGPEPPTGDPVRASQRPGSKTLKVSGFKWRFVCPYLQRVEPYPH
jgi:hypothetical protein